MRLLHVVGDSSFGGGSVVILKLAELGRSLGWDVDVLTTDPPFQDALARAGIGVVNIDVIWRNVRPGRDLRGLFSLHSYLRRNPYSLVHTHTSKGGFIGRLAASWAGVPAIVHTVHGFAFHEESSLLNRQLYASLERAASHWCNRIVTVSDFHRRWALGLRIGDERKVVSVPNGIPAERVSAIGARSLIKETGNVGSREIVFMSIGRLSRQKGLEYLLEAIPLLIPRIRVPFKVVIAGEGPLRPVLERRVARLEIEDRVSFLGFRRDIGNLLAMTDFVVLPSLWEGLSISLLEAMAAGKPIVTTTIGSNKEVTREGMAALLVPPKNPVALAHALVTLVEDRPLAKSLGESARERFLACYTDEHMLAGYRRLYHSVTGRAELIDS